MLDGAEGEEKAQGFAKSVIRFQRFVWDDGFPMGNGSSNQ
jgi:hypothetical protein